MTQEDLVSVVVPIYNVVFFLTRTLESLVGQSYENIEILLVDDGSTDGSDKICDEWAKKDDRIKVFHKTNGGVSSARNMGLAKARGKYVTFVDGDDYVSNSYVEYMHCLVTKYDTKMAMNYACFDIRNSEQTEVIENRMIKSEDAIIDVYESKINVAVWNKIYDSSFLKKNNIMFDETIWFGEGMLFNISCLACVNELAVGNKKVYYQVYNKNSAMRKFNMKSRKNGIKSIELQRDILKDRSKRISDAIDFHLKRYYMSMLIQILKSHTEKKYKKEYEACIEKVRGDYWIVLQSGVPLKEKIFYFVAYFFPVLMAKRVIYKENKLLKRKGIV